MRIDVQLIHEKLQGIAAALVAEVVAVEWLVGPGRGVLRVYIDRPGGDPRTAQDPARVGATADLCAAVSRAASPLLDELDLIEVPYDLEVSSPGLERPVQLRADFDRFAGLMIKVKTRAPLDGRASWEGTLRGTVDRDGDWAVRVQLGEETAEVPRRMISRARLAEVKTPRPPKPGKGPRAPKAPSDAAAGEPTPQSPSLTPNTSTTADGDPAPTGGR